MKLIEAIKTGKPFRLISWRPEDFFHKEPYGLCKITIEDAISDNWMVMDRTFRINESDIDESIAFAMKSVLHWENVMVVLKEELIKRSR